MHRTETRSQDEQRMWSERDRYEDDYGRQDLSTSQRSGPVENRQDQPGQGRSGGNWTGYIVPYRYYGPGYRGVGYYSVMYLGPTRSEAESQGEDDQTEFDQRDVDYGQGQGAGAAWRTGSGRSSMGGGYAGRGPKGYQRSDERLQEEISDRLMADDRIDASDLEITVKQGEVTLTGTVDDREAKRRAEDVAESVMGVRDVMNQIRVTSGSKVSPSASGGSRTSQGSKSRAATSSSSNPRTSRNGGRSNDQQPSTTSGTGQTQSRR